MFIKRRKTKQIKVGRVPVGGGAPVVVQSMTTPDTADVGATVEQIHQLEQVGCEIVRVTVNTPEAADALPAIKAQTQIPIIADIHFDYRLALKAAEVVDCVRINPGNIGAWWKVEEVVKAVRDRNIPLRIGVNGGSLERELLTKYGYPTAEALCESALNAVHALEDIGFTNMKVSLKASDVHMAVDAYRLFSLQADYPLHLGITEAGTLLTGSITIVASRARSRKHPWPNHLISAMSPDLNPAIPRAHAGCRATAPASGKKKGGPLWPHHSVPYVHV